MGVKSFTNSEANNSGGHAGLRLSLLVSQSRYMNKYAVSVNILWSKNDRLNENDLRVVMG